MPLTNEDREWLRDMLMFAKKYSLATLSIRLEMIECMLDQEPPPTDQIDVRLEALLHLYESKAEKWQSLTETATLIASEWEQCDRQRAEKAEAELERLRKDFSQETERAERAEKEYESARNILRNAYGNLTAEVTERAKKTEAELAKVQMEKLELRAALSRAAIRGANLVKAALSHPAVAAALEQPSPEVKE